jgi:6,7-dimethyl-8-ribityllumazine synthase
MATELKNLSEYDTTGFPDISTKQFGIVTAAYNPEITGALHKGAVNTLLKHGAQQDHIISKVVPGSFELTLAAQWLAERKEIDAVICIGCVIKGDTPHSDYICHAVAQGLKDVALKFNKPVIFGVLTPLSLEQAQDRAGGKHGNKGDEAAVSAIRMLGFN